MGSAAPGHFVKMVHNGIEYADMQLIAEAYDLLRTVGGLGNHAVKDVFARYGEGELRSYLVEITEKVLDVSDPENPAGGSGRRDPRRGRAEGDRPVDGADRARARRGRPHHRRGGGCADRVRHEGRARLRREAPPGAAARCGGRRRARPRRGARARALLPQGLLLCAGNGHDRRRERALRIWHRPDEVARIWKGGCIIRAALLDDIKRAFQEDSRLPNLMIAPRFREYLAAHQGAWRRTLERALAAEDRHAGALRVGRVLRLLPARALPANLIQAQRDFFGAHTYRRVDRTARSTPSGRGTAPRSKSDPRFPSWSPRAAVVPTDRKVSRQVTSTEQINDIDALTVAVVPEDWSEVDRRAVDTVRVLAADAVQKVGNGHPGTAMSLAPLAYTLFQRVMRHDPADPHWLGRDRFVLSCGHSSLTLYIQLYLAGFGLELDDLKALRTWGSLTPGHPEFHHTKGVEITTGPLGQGLASAVGMAMASRRERGLFDPDAAPGESPFDHFIYVVASDGDIEEGVTSEASSIAGRQQLGNLIVFYDHNEISIEDDTNIALSEDVAARYEAYGWHVQKVQGGENVVGILEAIEAAKAVTDKPSFIELRTIIGYPAPKLMNTGKAHGAALGAEEVAAVKTILGFDPDASFEVDDVVIKHTRGAVDRGEAAKRVAEGLRLVGGGEPGAQGAAGPADRTRAPRGGGSRRCRSGRSDPRGAWPPVPRPARC